MDPAVIAALAGPALAATVEFVSSRINAALDRRPTKISDREAALTVDDSAFTSERLERMRQVAEVLSVYRDHPEIARSDDSRLTRAISLAFADLSEVYKTEFRLDHAWEGVSVVQDLGHVGRPVTGLRASGIGKGANVTVRQRAIKVDESGSLIGLEIEGTIG